MAGQVSQGAHCAKHARPSHAPIPTCHGVGMGEERDPAPVPCALIARERVAAPERAHTARSAAAPSSSSSSVRYRVAFWRSLMVGIPSNQLAAPFQREPNAPAPLSWPASPPVAGSQIGSTTRTETRDQYVAVLRRSRRAAAGPARALAHVPGAARRAVGRRRAARGSARVTRHQVPPPPPPVVNKS